MKISEYRPWKGIALIALSIAVDFALARSGLIFILTTFGILIWADTMLKRERPQGNSFLTAPTSPADTSEMADRTAEVIKQELKRP